MNTAPMEPHPDERDELVRLLPELVERDLPSDRQRQLQEFVMTQIHQDLRPVEQAPGRRPTRRLAVAICALAAVAVAVAAAAIGGGGLGAGRGTDGLSALPGTDGPTTHSPVARTFELAAAYAATRSFTPPRPDQWIYIRNRKLAPSAVAKDKGQKPDQTEEIWKRADGRKMAEFNSNTGKLDTWDQDNEYPALSTLPTDPRALVSRLRAEVEGRHRADSGGPQPPLAAGPGTPEEVNAALFDQIARILFDNLLPPAVTAALWRTAALVPGVTRSSGTVEVDGRQVIAVGRVQEGWRFNQLLLDPDTHEFVGYRSVAVKDHTYTTGPNGPVTEKKGQAQFTITRLAAKIVDAAGQTR